MSKHTSTKSAVQSRKFELQKKKNKKVRNMQTHAKRLLPECIPSAPRFQVSHSSCVSEKDVVEVTDAPQGWTTTSAKGIAQADFVVDLDAEDGLFRSAVFAALPLAASYPLLVDEFWLALVS